MYAKSVYQMTDCHIYLKIYNQLSKHFNHMYISDYTHIARVIYTGAYNNISFLFAFRWFHGPNISESRTNNTLVESIEENLAKMNVDYSMKKEMEQLTVSGRAT